MLPVGRIELRSGLCRVFGRRCPRFSGKPASAGRGIMFAEELLSGQSRLRLPIPTTKVLHFLSDLCDKLSHFYHTFVELVRKVLD